MARKVVLKLAPEIHGYSDQRHVSVPFKIADVLAIQALGRGDADANQQAAALKWIIEVAGMAYEETYDPDNQYNSAFMQGRRYVGQRIGAMTKILPGALADVERRRIAEDEAEKSRNRRS